MHYTVTYLVEAPDIQKAAWNIAIGQSIGNPNIRNEIETADNIKEMEAQIVDIVDNKVRIKFPLKAWDWPNLNQLLCIIQGGQSDIECVSRCRVIDIEGLPYMNQPHLGLKKWKQRVGAENRPLFGGIVKPKSGLNKEQLLHIVQQMMDGGVDFIKEDEIMANNSYYPLRNRVRDVHEAIDKTGWKGVFAFCVNADPFQLCDNLRVVRDYGEACHINFWSGLGAYTTSHSLHVVTHFQRSGIRTWTDPGNKFSISWNVIVKLAIMAGVDSVHVGMLGGYYPEGESEEETLQAVSDLVNADRVAALSCGMNPEIARQIRGNIGNDWMANVGGWLHTGDSIYEKVYEMRKSLE
jgi:ribulose-bisphosphate carboxylase large chain